MLRINKMSKNYKSHTHTLELQLKQGRICQAAFLL